MRKSAKIISALSVAGLAVAAGSAFTGTGLTNTETTSQFIGGTVVQTVTGATLSNVTYGFSDDTKVLADSIALTFTGATGKSVAVDVSAAGSGGTFTCEVVGTTTLNVSNCNFVPAVAQEGYAGLSSLSIAVS